MMMQTFPTDIQPHGTVPVPAEWGNQVGSVLNQVQGGLHQVTVTGAQTVPVVNGHMYEVNATSTAQVTLTGDPGTQVGVVWAGASGTVAGSPIVDGATVVAVRLTAGWRVYPVGAAVVDTTPPTAGTLTVAVTSSTATLTATGAMDDVALHAQAYSFSKDNGATWTAWQSAASYEFTGLASSTAFSFQHRVRDAAGNVKIGTAVVKSTDVLRTWVTRSLLNFTAADGTLASAVTQTTGDVKWSAVTLLGSGTTPLKVLSNRAQTETGVNSTQSWDLRSAPQVHGLRCTLDYDLSVQSTPYNHTLGFATTYDKPSRDYAGVNLTFRGSTLDIDVDGTYVDAITGASKTTGVPLTGTITVEFGVSSITVSINGVVKGSSTITGTLRGEGVQIGTNDQTVAVDNARFEALQ